MNPEREVIHCKTCGLVQYRTAAGKCRRCQRAIQAKTEYLIPATPVEPPQLPVDYRKLFEKWPNIATVQNIGQRIAQLRQSRGVTQNGLQKMSRVSRSYLSRIESGQMTPSLATLERISEALDISLNLFFIPMSNGEALLEDPFIQEVRPLLQQIVWDQWQAILTRLAAISNKVASGRPHIIPLAQPHLSPMEDVARRSNSLGRDGQSLAG
jgi:transcriptional regulator with XRE-family HTH domain